MHLIQFFEILVSYNRLAVALQGKNFLRTKPCHFHLIEFRTTYAVVYTLGLFQYLLHCIMRKKFQNLKYSFTCFRKNEIGKLGN